MHHGDHFSPQDNSPMTPEEFERLYERYGGRPHDPGIAPHYALVAKVTADLDVFRAQSAEEREKTRAEMVASRRALEKHIEEEMPSTARRKVNACVILCLGLLVIEFHPALSLLREYGIPEGPTIAAFLAWAAYEFFGIRLPWRK